jgi:hypothetical protein
VGSTARPAINLSCCWDPWGVRAVSPTPTPRGLWVFFCAREVKFARVGRATTSERGACFRLSCPMAWPVGWGVGARWIDRVPRVVSEGVARVAVSTTRFSALVSCSCQGLDSQPSLAHIVSSFHLHAPTHTHATHPLVWHRRRLCGGMCPPSRSYFDEAQRTMPATTWLGCPPVCLHDVDRAWACDLRVAAIKLPPPPHPHPSSPFPLRTTSCSSDASSWLEFR